jgi:16S rRNA (cytosine967-C5)-methyltransferase
VRPRRADRRSAARPVEAPGLAARRVAADLVEGVLGDGRTLAELTAREGPLMRLAPVDRARARSLADAVLRHLPRIDAVLAPHLRQPPPGRARTALRLAAAEMLAEGVPAHAAVDAAVNLARGHPKTRHLAGLVNAVARKLAADGPRLWAEAPPARLPDWLAGPVTAAWGAEAAVEIAAAHVGRPPLDLTLRDPSTAPALGASPRD